MSLALFAVARRQSLAVPRPMWSRLVLVSLLTIGGWVAFMGLALLWLNASEAAVLGISIPVWVALLAWPILGERLSPGRAISLAVALAGIAWIPIATLWLGYGDGAVIFIVLLPLVISSFDPHGLAGLGISVVTTLTVFRPEPEELGLTRMLGGAALEGSFTAATILAMVDQGLIQLDAPTSTYLHNVALVKGTTVRQLLSHEAGLVCIDEPLRPEDMPDMPELNDGPEFIRWVEMPRDVEEVYKRMKRHLVAELKKVVRPTRNELMTYFVVVLVFVAVIMAFVGLLDLSFGRLAGR